MNLIENFNDYLLETILENVKNDETALVISKNLRNYLKIIDDNISNDILFMCDDKYNTKVKITLLDIVEKEGVYDLISFVQSNKAIQTVAKEHGIELSRESELSKDNKDSIAYFLVNYSRYFDEVKGRAETTLGRVINKLFPNKYKDHEIGIFVEKFKSLRKPFETFELVKGDDIRYWYNYKRYKIPDNASTIWRSCMRHDECYDYLQFYSINPDKVSLLILKDPQDLSVILGRAIVWKIDEIEGEKIDENEPRYFMDRIYYYQDYIMNAFINHAVSQGWIYKAGQNMNPNEDLIDKKNDKVYHDVKIYDVKDSGNGNYPYIDTVRYYNIDTNELSNKPVGNHIEFVHTDGTAEGIEEEGDYYSEYYGEYINTEDDDYHYCEYGDDYRYYDDCFYSDFYDVYVTNDYAENYGVYCDYVYRHEDSWRKNGDYVDIYGRNETATENYADNYLVYSDYINSYLKDDDSVWSEYHNTYLYTDESVEVYLDVEQSNTDWRADDDRTWFKWKQDGEKYDNGISIEDLEKYHKDDDKEL